MIRHLTFFSLLALSLPLAVGCDFDVDDIIAESDGGSGACRDLEGSVTARNAEELALYADVCSISGELIVDADGVTAVEFPMLKIVQGKVEISGSVIERIDLGQLRSTPWLVIRGSASVLNLESLETARWLWVHAGVDELQLTALNEVEDLQYTSRISEVTVQLPSLVEFDGELSFASQGGLTINLPNLTRYTGGLGVSAGEPGAALLLPQLTWGSNLGSVNLRRLVAPQLTRLNAFTASQLHLEHMQWPFESIKKLSVRGSQLERMVLPNLEWINTLQVGSSPSLAHIELPNLREVNTAFEFSSLPALEVCTPQIIFDRLDVIPAERDVYIHDIAACD